MAITRLNSLAIPDGTVVAADLAAGAVDTTSLENDIGLLNVARLVDGAATWNEFRDGWSDAFADETKVNTSTTTMFYNSSTNEYYPEGTGYNWTYFTDSGQFSGTNYPTNSGNDWAIGLSNSSSNNYRFKSPTSTLGGNIRTNIRWVDPADYRAIEYKKNQNATNNTGFMVGIIQDDYLSHLGTGTSDWAYSVFWTTQWANGDPESAGVKGFMAYTSDDSSSSKTYLYGVAQTPNGTDLGVTGLNAVRFYKSSLSASDWKISINGSDVHTLASEGQVSGAYYLLVMSSAEGTHGDWDYLRWGNPDKTNPASSALFQTSASGTVTSAPSSARLIVIGKPEQTQTINSDTVFSVSRDNGSNFSTVTMAEKFDYNSSGVKVYEGTVDVSGQPSGTNLIWKVATSASKGFTVHGYTMLHK